MADQVFVAREQELRLLWQFLDRALASQGQVCLVTGEAGRGKTSLVTEFARKAQEAHADLLVAIGNCNAQTGVGDPYLPFREVLGMLTGDVEAKLAQGATTPRNARRLRAFLGYAGQALVELGPDLVGLFVPGAGLAAQLGTFVVDKVGWLDKLEKLTGRKAIEPGELDQSRIFEEYTNVLRAMAEKQPLMLLLDDLQWADVASISLLFHLGRHVGQDRVLVIGAYRPEEVALGRGGERHPLEKVLTEFKRYFGYIAVDLDRTDEAQGRRFVDAFLDVEPNRLGEGFRQALFQHTGGHPLFTVELLRDMQERGDILQDGQGRWVEGSALNWEMLPARVEGVIEERICRLEEDLRDILSVASVEGQDFTAQVIARVEEVRERQLLRKLSQELDKRHHLVREQEEVRIGRQFLSRYQFAHALFQQYMYNELGAGERRMLHGEIAAVLEELYQGQTEEITVQLARHYSEAGQGEKAIGYLLQAGDRARNLYAYQEAIDFYQRALEFLRERGEYERTARTLMKLGLTYHIAFDFRRARQAYEEGFVLWQRVGETPPAVSLPPAPHALRVGWPYPPLTLDPALAADFDSSGVVDSLFSGLVSLSPGMEVVPDVARSWEVLEGGREYVFHLRDDVYWSDGTPVTAEDFAYAWRRALAPATGSPTAGLLYGIKGARAFHRGEVSDPGGVGVRTPDEATLAVELERPTGHFLYLLAHNISYPVPRHAVEALGETWTEVANLVTNGPFRLEAWSQEEELVLSRDPTYHGRFTGNVECVCLVSLPETSARLETYETENLDVLSLWNRPEEMTGARQRHAGDYVSAPWLATTYMGFNVNAPPFDDPQIRLAFSLAVDRERWADEVMGGYYFPATGGFVPPGMPGHSPGIGLTYDPDRGRRLLAEAGYPDGDGFPPVEFLTDKGHKRTSGYLVSQWLENLDVETRENTEEWVEFLGRMEEEPPHIFLGTWYADHPDPDNFLRVCDAIRWTRCQNETFHELVDRARRVTDQRERIKMYCQADRVLVGEAVLMPFAYERTHLLVKPWVRQLPTSAIKWWYWQDAIIEPH